MTLTRREKRRMQRTLDKIDDRAVMIPKTVVQGRQVLIPLEDYIYLFRHVEAYHKENIADNLSQSEVEILNQLKKPEPEEV